MSFIVHRVSKNAARYTDAGGREKCGQCRFFVAPRACGKVIGPVSPRGWCKYFSRQVSQQYSGSVLAGGGPPGATLALDFMSSGNMPAGVTFSRASTATYTDPTGTIQTAAVNQPRWDYAGGVLRGLLIEGASAPRAQEQCGILTANMSPWFSTVGTWFVEFIITSSTPDGQRILGAATTVGSGITPLTAGNTPYHLGQWDGASYFETANNITPNVVQKGAHTSIGPGIMKLCLNGGPIASGVATNGFAALGVSGVRFFQTVVGPSPDNGSGYIRRVQFWPRVLSDAEMQQVTT